MHIADLDLPLRPPVARPAIVRPPARQYVVASAQRATCSPVRPAGPAIPELFDACSCVLFAARALGPARLRTGPHGVEIRLHSSRSLPGVFARLGAVVDAANQRLRETPWQLMLHADGRV